MGSPDSTSPTRVPPVTVETTSAQPTDSGSQSSSSPPTSDDGAGRFRRLARSPATVAIITWLVAMPFAYLIPRLTDLDPFTENGIFVPLGVGGVLLVGMTALAWRRGAGDLVAASSAGLFAAWVALCFRVGLYGSQFGTTGLQGDRGRVAAVATKNTVTWLPVDPFVDGVPAEYPPLFPWLVGRAAVLLDVSAWKLLAVAEVVLLSLAVLTAFLLWRKLVSAPVALVLSAVGVLVYGDPRKAFGAITLFVFVPWIIAAFTENSRWRMHWLPAGVIAGLTMMSYSGWYPFGVLGVLAVIVSVWRRSADRVAYLRHVLLLAATAVIVALPYLVPWLGGVLTREGQAISDEYVTSHLSTHSFPFLKPTLLGALELIGLAGLVWYRRRTEWAWPLLYLVIGSYLYWLITGIRFMFSKHTTLFYYVPLLTGAALISAGVLTLAHAGPALARRLTISPPYRTGAAVSAVALLWVGFTYWMDWRPSLEAGTASTFNQYSAWAHLEPGPDCGYPRFAPAQGRLGCYPANSIKAEVERVRGVGDRPRTLASDERLYAFLPWPGYMGVDRTSANTLVRWDDRQAEVIRLSRISDPAEFSQQTSDSELGRIDLFAMYRASAVDWLVVGATFHPDQFDPAQWIIVENMPSASDTVIAIRRP